MTFPATRSPLLSSEPTFTDVAGTRTRHITVGEGAPVVLLHGIGRSLEDWSDTIWPLAEQYRVHALDLIGFGYTDKPHVPYTLGGLARFVRHYLDAVGETRPVAFIGNSLGGAVAQHFATRHPQRTRALILVNSAGFGAQVMPLLRALAVPAFGELMARPSRLTAEQTVRSIFHDPSFVTPERINLALDLARQPGAGAAFLAVLRDLTSWRGGRPEWRADLIRRLAPLNIPTLAVWGEHDRVLPAQQLVELRRHYPHARTHLFEGTGHMPQIERAAQFNTLVRDFLREHHA